jgi:hypothetical protein
MRLDYSQREGSRLIGLIGFSDHVVQIPDPIRSYSFFPRR